LTELQVRLEINGIIIFQQKELNISNYSITLYISKIAQNLLNLKIKILLVRSQQIFLTMPYL